MATQPLQSTSANQPPSLRNQLTIKNLADLQNTLHKVAPKRIDFGLQLGVEYSTLCTIQENHGRVQDQLREILAHRLTQPPPLTWHDVVQALQSNAVQMNDLASELESHHMCQSSHEPQGMAQSHGTGFDSESLQVRRKHKSQIAQSHDSGSDSDTPHEEGKHKPQIIQYIKYIKTLYQQSEVEKKLNAIKWPPTPSTVYINLVCVDRTTDVSKEEADECTRAMVCDGSVDVILKKKTSIDFNNIAKDVPPLKRKVILVEGAPGVGKSTLSWEFCRRWERGEIAQQYQLVLLLRLRDKEMSEAQSLADLLYHPSKAVVQAVEDELIATLGANTLIILEGFDELPSTCRTQSSVFLRLINGTLLPHATVLVTSRPWATQDLHKQCCDRIFQHIEILGFTGKQIEEYVTSVFTEEGKPANNKAKKNIEEVMSYIKTYPQIKACMYIPLNSAIVVCVYQESKAGRCILPKTLTQLYFALTQTLLLRYLYGHPEYSQKMWKIQSLKENLPPDVYSKLLAISELAYTGICTGDSVQLIFSNLPPDFETLGLMQSVPQMYVTQGEDMPHNFLHLTVQEFLAALHISNMTPEKQLEHFQKGRWWKEKGRWRVVLRFLAGITKLANLSPEDLRGLLQEERHEWEKWRQTADVLLAIQHVNWMFETQRDDNILVLHKKTVAFRCHSGLTPLDYYSLGYIIVHSHYKWELTRDGDMEEEEVRMLVDGANTRRDTSARVVRLRGRPVNNYDGHGYNPLSISTEALNLLFTSLQNVIHLQELHLKLPVECDRIEWPNLSGLRVLHLGVSDERNWRLDTLLPHLSLESLTIEVARGLSLDNIAFIGELFSHSMCPKHVNVTDNHSLITAKVVNDQHVHDKHSENRASSAHEDQPNKDITCCLDCYSLGCIIVHSHLHWELTVYKTKRKKREIGEQEVRMLVEGANTRRDTSARVVSLACGYWRDFPLPISAGALYALFTGLQDILDLKKLRLYLPEDCSSIKWPNLSGLRVLHLGVSDERNWRLDTLLPHLSLESLTIEVTEGLSLDNIAFIGELLFHSTCLEHVDITDNHSPITAKVVKDQHVHDKHSENRASSAHEDQPIKDITCRLDCYSLGYIIVHSHLHWTLTVYDETEREKIEIGEQEVRMLVEGANTRRDTSARVVSLASGYWSDSPLSISAGALNALFTGLQDIFDLKKLHLYLPEGCSRIKWPDLSGLQELHLGVSDERNWTLYYLMYH